MSKEFDPDNYVEQMQKAVDNEDDLERQARERATKSAQNKTKGKPVIRKAK